MLSLQNYIEYDCSYPDAIISYLIEFDKATTSDLMKIRCNGKRMAAVSTYVSKARRKLAKKGMELVCEKNGEIGSPDTVFTYYIKYAQA